MRLRVLGGIFGITCALLGLSAPAQAERVVISNALLNAKTVPGTLEGACGISLIPSFYVSDYYHHGIDSFSEGIFSSRTLFGPLDGPCQLAGFGKNLYANEWHRGVSRVLPTPLSFDQNESTGLAVDRSTGALYVNDRTYVAAYEPSGAPVLKEGGPLRIGEGTLQDAYGLAYSEGKLYVPDAATETIKVYEPAVNIVNPVFTITGSATPQKGFNSLLDASVAVDPTNGHLLAIHNLQPGFEHPEAAVDEFDSSGVFIGQLAKRVIDGGPSGLAFDSSGNLYVTTGNAEESNVTEFGPYSAAGSFSAEAQSENPSSSPPVRSAAIRGDFSGSTNSTASQGKHPGSEAVVIARGGIKVSFAGKLAPKKLPREEPAPVRVSVAAKIAPVNDARPPQLRTISIAINRYGHFNTTGLPLCTERDIQPATTQNALAACRSSLVGVGSFSANVAVSRQSPFPAEGKMYAFNAEINGKPAILAHVYGTRPVPTSLTFPFVLTPSKGTYGTTLTAKLPQANGASYVTGLSMSLGRSFHSHGKQRSYLSASCPAPKGFHKAPFPLAHANFAFKGGKKIGSTLVQSCVVRG